MDGQATTNVTYRRTKGSFQVYEDGSVSFTPVTDSSCCGCATSPVALSGADVIGASVIEAENAFLVYHCPANSKQQRNLVKVGPFYCPDIGSAQQIARDVRSMSASRGDLQLMGHTVLAVINPLAGNGKAQDTWLTLQGVLHAAGIACDALISTHAGHTIPAVASQNLSQYKCIMVLGGDGSVHEVIQGLRHHLESPASLRLPICHVPAGSGNGLAASCGLWTPLAAVHAMVKGRLRAVDAATVRQESEPNSKLAVLSLQYGLLSNLDFGTEHLRKWLGGERFTYGAVKEVMRWTKHKARVAYCTTAAAMVGSSHGSHGSLACPLLEEVQSLTLGNPQQWPSSWVVQDKDSIRYLNVASPVWATLDAKLNPWGVMDDGLWEFAIDKCQGRKDALKMITISQSGKHEDSPLFEVQRVGAFIIEPYGETSYLSVDGEKVATERLEFEVHRRLLTFVVAPEP